MMNIKPIPLSLLPSNMTVRVPTNGTYGGAYGEPVEVANVRYDSSSELIGKKHLLTDGASGIVFVDAYHSEGAFNVPEGSLVSIDGAPEVSVVRVDVFKPYDEIHHWELIVK